MVPPSPYCSNRQWLLTKWMKISRFMHWHAIPMVWQVKLVAFCVINVQPIEDLKTPPLGWSDLGLSGNTWGFTPPLWGVDNFLFTPWSSAYVRIDTRYWRGVVFVFSLFIIIWQYLCVIYYHLAVSLCHLFFAMFFQVSENQRSWWSCSSFEYSLNHTIFIQLIIHKSTHIISLSYISSFLFGLLVLYDLALSLGL